VLLGELRERGYTGGYTMLKALVASLKPKEAAAPIVRFETKPGEQMQVDCAVIRRGGNRLSVFVATLGWSRASYVEFVTDERGETLIEAHENAFLAFGGAPHEVLYDNMRTVVLERHGYGRGRHRFNPGFLDFARHYGFQPRLCAPYRAQTKGKVERFIRYLRESFWVPLSSRLTQEGLVVDRATANLAVKRWLREVANARIHGTTGAIPAERLVSERLQLRDSARPGSQQTRRWRKVDSNLYGAFPVKWLFWVLLRVLCSERESRSSSRRLRSGSRSARKRSRDRNASRAWRLAA
jgi:transposase